MDFNREEVHEQLQQNEEKWGDIDKIPEVMEEYIRLVAKTGDILYPWSSVKPLLLKKINIVTDEFNESCPVPSNALNTPPFNFEGCKKEVLSFLDSFQGAPFTIQRLCEIICFPHKHYKRSDKLMRAIEKNVLVVSYVDTTDDPHDRAPSPPKSIFAQEGSYLLFGSSGEASTSSSLLSMPDVQLSSSSSSTSTSSSASFSTSSSLPITPIDSYLDIGHHPVGTSSHSLSSSTSLPSSSSHRLMTAPSIDIEDEDESSKILLPSLNVPAPQSPAPLQQLDSFTTVFSSPPSTPLAVVSNMGPFVDNGSSSSSSSESESSGSSPLGIYHHDINGDVINFGDNDVNSEMLHTFIGTDSDKDSNVSSHMVSASSDCHLTDGLVTSPVVQAKDAMQGGSGLEGDELVSFDPKSDPELAVVLRVSIEEQQQPLTEPVPDSTSASSVDVDNQDVEGVISSGLQEVDKEEDELLEQTGHLHDQSFGANHDSSANVEVTSTTEDEQVTSFPLPKSPAQERQGPEDMEVDENEKIKKEGEYKTKMEEEDKKKVEPVEDETKNIGEEEVAKKMEDENKLQEEVDKKIEGEDKDEENKK